jgi:hypothetical protein
MRGYPRVRSEGTLTKEVGDELVVYDEATKTAHVLSAEACSL